MRRNQLTSCIALAALAVLAAILALRFDLASLLFSDVTATAQVRHASAMNSARASGSPVTIDRRPGEDRAGKPSSTFDVVRIDPDGASVFAGRAPANASVTVLANDKPVATAKANANGEWAAVIDRQFAPGEYQLSLTAKPSDASAPLSGQSVRITIASSARPAPADSKIAALGQTAAAPAPITFAYDAASLTASGHKQAAALSEFLRQRQLASVTLSGHADERGTDAYNIALSRNRLESVARYLLQSGYVGKLVLVPKGRSEPFGGVDRSKLSKEDAFRFDRRVELNLAR